LREVIIAKERDLVAQAEGDRAEARQLAATFNESTGLSWLWALLFGPLYFWVHGFVARGFVLLGISIITLGFGLLLAPFIVYPAWRKKAEQKANDLVAISRARDGRP
jgi:hypothetical protein